jgi:hypothetical protein
MYYVRSHYKMLTKKKKKGYAPYTGATPLRPGTTWRYLGFFFDHSLTFQEHVKRYTNEALTSVRAMLALGNSVCGLRPKHKRLLYRSCVLPIATYGSHLWMYKGAHMAGPLDSLRVMQRHACLWITGSFKTSPRGAAETLAGIPPIHLHVQKLVERSHVRTRSLQATHAFRRLVDGDHKYSVESLQHRIKGNLVSPITEAWRNLGISSVDLDPVHRFAQPSLRPRDLFPRRIVLDIVKPPAKADKDHKEFMAERSRHLACKVDAASHSPQRVCIVTDASMPPLPLQSVAAYRVWQEGDLYTDWRSAGLSTSDDAELQAIVAGVDQAYDIGLKDVRQVHVFSDSTNALCLCMDASHHSGQPASLAICWLLVPWLKQHANNSVHLHHITPGVELEDHQLTHIHATLTRVEAGGEPIISADFARSEAVTRMLSGWNALFRTKKYVSSNFLPLYQGKNTLLVPTHVNSGPWMRRMGHSHELTARLVRCITGHAPIRLFRSRFFPLESTACRCGLPMETVSHVLYRCPLHEWEEEPSEKLPYKWLINFLITNESAFAFDVH